MIITNAKHEIITETEPLKKIERIARICYKSEDKITDGSDIKMINMLIARKHTAMLEHANIIVSVPESVYTAVKTDIETVLETIPAINIPDRCYLRFTKHSKYIISGNIRAWYEYFSNKFFNRNKELYVVINKHIHNIFNFFDETEIETHNTCHIITDMSELSDEERMIHEEISVIFTTDRGVTHELVRMRKASFAQESTRYCNYSADKFGNHITVIKPCFWNNEIVTNDITGAALSKYTAWQAACESAEHYYFALLSNGATPQEARDVLPTSVKSEIVVTANLTEWCHILNLRACDATGKAHPQMHEITIPLLNDVKISHPFAFSALNAK